MAEPVYGQIKAGKAPFINSAAKYLVCGELRRRGIRAEPGPLNNGKILLSGSGVIVRVKAKTAASGSWVWNADAQGALFGALTAKDFSVLVDLNDGTQCVDYHIVPTTEIEKELRREHGMWVKTPGAKGQRHDPRNPMHRIGYDDRQRKWLERHRDWSILMNQLKAIKTR